MTFFKVMLYVLLHGKEVAAILKAIQKNRRHIERVRLRPDFGLRMAQLGIEIVVAKADKVVSPMEASAIEAALLDVLDEIEVRDE